jgi:hypothetical protein
MAVKLPSGTREILRSLAPWVVASLLLQLGLRVVWLDQTRSFRADFARAAELRAVVPEPASLGTRIGSLEKDSVLLDSRLASARGRTLESSDPGAELAARLVPLLGREGWKLQRVKAESKAGWATLDLGAEADFEQILSGLRRIRIQPTALQVRRFSVRPSGSGRLGVELQVASPIGAEP